MLISIYLLIAALLGYAIDGFGIFALSDIDREEPTGLDECKGHEDGIRGFHYHAGKPVEAIKF